ncbi:MAG: type IV pilin protein [Methylophaga sp.]|uniref:type IV pilin protein n=1 Tax=Methylophaga sp. TaxID=2024840 RepID=UPI00299DC79F|nr:type IV pilin protein [Methylophaga sp.]MDX1749767.1 type IV pilin protein [Methylophaga sp.]
MKLKKLNITSQKAMTLIELMLVIAVLGVIVTIAIPSYQSYIDKTDNALAVSQIVNIQSVIERYYLQNHRYPAKLDDIAGSLPDNGVDPWGNKYIYLNIADDWPRTRGPSRKDRNINPINTQYDLYSMGKDGQTKKQVSQKDSLDDVILARDGRFIGLAADF